MSRILQSKNNLITQNYDANTHPAIDTVGENHKSDYIIAYDNGVVTEVRKDYKTTDKTGSSYGNYVKIKHAENFYTLYAHLKYGSVGVSVGQTVKRGEVIGYMGATGRATGVHLHFEMRSSSSASTRFNPTPYLDSDYLSLNTSLKTNDIIVDEVIKGLWGNGEDRKTKLTQAGYNYSEIQTLVNQKIYKNSVKNSLENVTIYIVQSGDNLSTIAKKYNTTWQKIYEDNKGIIGSNPNLIVPGQKLEIK